MIAGTPDSIVSDNRGVIWRFSTKRHAKSYSQNHIPRFEFNIDTGKGKPIRCEQPQYEPHESRVLVTLIEKLEKRWIIEDGDGPWRSPVVVLASKPDQVHVQWSEFVFRLCILYRMLHTVTQPFTFPITRWDEAVESVGDVQYYIIADFLMPRLNTKMKEAIRMVKEKWEAASKTDQESASIEQDSTEQVKIDDIMEDLLPCKETPFSLTWQKPGEFELLPGLAVTIDKQILFDHTATALLYYFTFTIEIL